MSILLAKLLHYRPTLLGAAESRLRRFVTRSRRVIGWFLIELLLATAILLPFNETANASATDWSNWAADPAHWISHPPIGAWASAVSVPTDNFTLFGAGTFMPGATGGVGASTQMISGDKWITLGRETVGTAGVSNQQISSAMEKFPKNAAYVFAQFSPSNATGRIVIQKVEKMPNGSIQVYQADFTPWSGELWKAQGKYRSPSEIAAGDPGYNPFEIFKGAQNDPLFHNVGWDAMQVAVGHAMRHYGATLGFVAVSNVTHTQQTSSESISLGFRNKVTTIVNTYNQPQWFVATPIEAASLGNTTGQICVGAGTTATSCDGITEHLVTAGAAFSPWSGGNMPQNQDLMGTYVNSQSSWNVLFFTLLVVVLTAGFAAVLTPEIAAVDAAAVGGEVGSGYALASTVFGSGGSLLQSQERLLGATGNGWVGQMTATGSPFEQQIENGTMAAVNNRFIGAPLGSGNSSATDALYMGNCAKNSTVAQCQAAGQDPGTIWRPDSYAEYNGTKAMRQRNTACTTLANQQNLQGDARRIWIEQCAAPAVGAIQ